MKPLAPCGTQAAYRRHLRRGEPSCAACRAANVESVAAYRARPPAAAPRELRPCGTPAAYDRHLRRREVPCPACCAAHAAQQRAWVTQKQDVAS